jgi:hypothetical protein
MILKRYSLLRHLPFALGLWLLAAVTRLWLAPQWLELPTDYAEETSYAAHSRYRDTPDGAWQRFDSVVRRVDQTLVASAENNIIEGDIHWTTEAGEVTYESAGIYGVDRRTRVNLSGYGNIERRGQFLFPPHLGKITYHFWDPFYTGPRTATFSHTTTLDGMLVYVFDCRAKNIDDTAGYAFLRDVPERYRAYSAGTGRLWIEPVSGIVVDFEDVGKSFFGEPATARPVSNFYFWNARYTPQTRATQFQRALSARRRIVVLEIWVPLGLLLCGLMWLTLGLRRASPGYKRAPTGNAP